MALFPGKTILMFTRCLMPRLGEMLIASTTTAAVRNQHALSGRCQVGNRLTSLLVKRQRADRHLQEHVFARVARAIGAFSVSAPRGPKFAIVAVTQQRVVVRIGFEKDAAAVAAVASGGPAARNILLASERHAAIAAVARFHENLRFIDKHWK